MNMTMKQFETLTLEKQRHVAVLTLNRPDKMNAFNGQMMLDLIAAFDATDQDDDVCAVVMTGAGRAFCAGADLSAGAATFDYAERAKRGEPGRMGEDEQGRDGGGRVTLRIFNSLKPIIGAINGAAVGVGATMQLPMDMRLASMQARFGFVFARRGIVPEAASSWFLSRLVGPSTALEWCYSGRVFDANEALARGLVRSVHAADELLPAALAIAYEIAENSAPVSVALTRRMIWGMLGAEHPMLAHRMDSAVMRQRGASADAREGVASFLEKRPAQFAQKVSDSMPDLSAFLTDPPFSEVD